MVIGAFPIVKLGGLLLRQISKPIANAAKERAKGHPFFRKHICMPPAQFYNWCEIKTKMWILNLGKPVNIPVLNEAMAIELGANLLGEGIVFIVAAGLLVAEYRRQSKNEALKEATRKEDLNNLLNHLDELTFRVEQQEAQIRELQRNIFSSGATRTTKSSNDKTPPAAGPPLPTDPSKKEISSPVSVNATNVQPKSFILRAADAIREEIFVSQESDYRETGLLAKALLHLKLCMRNI